MKIQNLGVLAVPKVISKGGFMASTKVDILAIGAHCGDVEISMGMALAHHVRLGKKVAILHMTPGEKGHPQMPPVDYAQQREREAKESAALLNAPVYFLPYFDGELPVNEEVKFAVCDIIRDCRPDIVLTHWSASIHKDHTNCSLNIPDAIFYAAIRHFQREEPAHWVRSLYYAENWEDPYGFEPEIYLEISEEDLDLWKQVVSKHALFRGEVVKFPYVDHYLALARVRGTEIGCDYATAFAVPPNSRRRRVKELA